ncbi:MAG: four helix bundle protein [Pyrinomonadaceae bacterium]
MARFERFEEIEGWKLARQVTNQVYELSSAPEFSRDFALVNQMRRASVSIMSNIAEGFERDGNKEFLQFLSIAKGSCGEVRSQLYVALDRKYLDDRRFHSVSSLLIETSKVLSGLMKYLKQSEERGRKFK